MKTIGQLMFVCLETKVFEITYMYIQKMLIVVN